MNLTSYLIHETTIEHEEITTDEIKIDEEDEIDIIYELDKGMYGE